MFYDRLKNCSGNKVHFTSLGCPRNLVDTEVMLGVLLHAGYEATANLKEADFLIVNTCGFLQAARDEAKETIDQLLKEKKPEAKLIATGCMVQKHKGELERQFPGIHYFLGSGDAALILDALQSEAKGAQVTSARSFLEAGEVPRQLSTPKHFAYLKIAEGCRKACSYCIIPSIKGPLRSKTNVQVKKEFEILLGKGVKEIILIAQDLGDFGKDRKESDALPGLLEELLTVPGDYWLRMLYLYPDEITDGIYELMKRDERLLKYVDLPIQHINDDILKAMRRKTNKEQITSTIKRLREELPGIVIRTSLIVGFPGETEEQFQELAVFLQEYALDNVGIFKFSPEPGSHAASLSDQVVEEVKERRYHELVAVQQRVVGKKLKKLKGKRFSVVIEGYHPETQLLMVGRYYGQCPDIDGQVIINDVSCVDSFGERYLVEITGHAGYDLVGRAIKKKPFNPCEG